MAEPVTALVDPALPDDWRRVDLANGVAFARDDDLSRHDNDIQYAEATVFMSAADSTSPIEFAESLMARRVRQGYPERFSAIVDGLDALGFEWTDGVANIRSYFVSHPRGAVIELQVATHWSPDCPTPPSLPDLASELIQRVRWR